MGKEMLSKQTVETSGGIKYLAITFKSKHVQLHRLSEGKGYHWGMYSPHDADFKVYRKGFKVRHIKGYRPSDISNLATMLYSFDKDVN